LVNGFPDISGGWRFGGECAYSCERQNN